MKTVAHTFIALLVAACAWPVVAGAQTHRATIVFDLDGNGRRELIVLDGEKDQALNIRQDGKLLWQGVPGSWKPWKLMVADVDGDGKSEIIVGVYKATRYFQRPHNCLFVYAWDGRRAYPKWLGSSLSKPFIDFTFADLDHDNQNELIAVETRRDGKQSVAVYSWNGFGFTLEWQRGAWQSTRLIVGETRDVIVEADGERIVLGKE